MPQVWNIGNTTVRNPKRIDSALRVFCEKGFSGNAKGSEREEALHAMLKEEKVLDFEGKPSDWNGRKWRAAFYQLGFVSFEDYKINGKTLSTKELFGQIGDNEISRPYEITEAGLKLIHAKTVPEIEDIYLRQMACYELPSSIEHSFSEGRLKPFILFLQVLQLLQDGEHEGLSKFETGLFIQKFQNHTSNLPSEILQEILTLRKRLSKCRTTKETKDLKNDYLLELKKFVRINPLSVVNDYADTTFRYFSLTGVLSRVTDRIVIRKSSKNFVKKLLEDEPNFLTEQGEVEYFEKFYKNIYRIPIDDPEFAFQEITDLKSNIRDSSNTLLKKIDKLKSTSKLEVLHQIRYELIEYNNWEREEDYANEQQSDSAIRNVLDYLAKLNNAKPVNSVEIEDKPAFLEWAVWRSFLAIDQIISPIHTTRRFPIDQDFFPRNTAPGGGPDLLFEFESYALAVEVTLTTSHRQMAVEIEPVSRHLVNYKEKFPTKDLYCLFIAPSIDSNIVERFKVGRWFDELDVEHAINIVPMTLTDFTNAIETLIGYRFKNSDFRNLLDRCLRGRNEQTPQWKRSITKEVDEWKKRHLQ